MALELPRARMLVAIAAAFAALESVPDPLTTADRAAHIAAAANDAERPAALCETLRASAQAPRLALPHLLAAALARECAADKTARREIERAARAEPFRGPVQLEVAHDRLIDAVEHRDDAATMERLLEEASRAFAAAVATDAVDCTAAYAALMSAAAPAACFDRVAGSDPHRLEALIEHHAACADEVDALAVADRLDALRADGTQHGRALAQRRLGAANFAAGRAAQAAENFRIAAELAGDPDGLALDRADAHFAAGDEAAGAKLLLHALASGEADATRAAGSIHSAIHPEKAARALLVAGLALGDVNVRSQCAAVFAELGERERQRQLLAAGDPR